MMDDRIVERFEDCRDLDHTWICRFGCLEPIDEGTTNPSIQKEIQNFSKFFQLLLSYPREDLRVDEHVARVCGLSDVSASDCLRTLGGSGSVPSNVQNVGAIWGTRLETSEEIMNLQIRHNSFQLNPISLFT